MDAVEKEYEVEMDATEKEHEVEIDAMETEHQVEMDATETEHQVEMDATKTEHKVEMDATETDYEDEIEKTEAVTASRTPLYTLFGHDTDWIQTQPIIIQQLPFDSFFHEIAGVFFQEYDQKDQ